MYLLFCLLYLKLIAFIPGPKASYSVWGEGQLTHLTPFQLDLKNIPEEVVKETADYKCLQSQFSLLYNESLGVKTQLDEARALLLTAKNAHLRQIEHMEVRSTNLADRFYLQSL